MRDALPAEAGTRQGAADPNKGRGKEKTPPVPSTEVPPPYPSAYGKVFFTDKKTDYVCSGTALVSANESLVWTAGHCVSEGPGGFFKNFLFVPAYRDGDATPYGTFAATTLLTTSGWQESGEFGVDLGAAVVGDNGSGQTLSEAVSEASIVFNAPRAQTYSLYGYPAGKPFDGQRLRVCQTSWLRDDAATPDTMGASCDMTGGSSGGAWVTSTGGVASVVSYGYPNLRNVLFGPHLETEAQSLYEAAQAR
jgi:V8-like Glu-specific endopeptidase